MEKGKIFFLPTSRRMKKEKFFLEKEKSSERKVELAQTLPSRDVLRPKVKEKNTMLRIASSLGFRDGPIFFVEKDEVWVIFSRFFLTFAQISVNYG
ncbi:MAG: hypothetical protein IK000_08335 [Bacteroidaceae bacterium]|nr:hypothetical protein [Bacteroidaceae bacterium]